MDPTAIIEEQVRFGVPNRNSLRLGAPSTGPALTGILGYPAEGQPTRAVLLCSPHPHFAGDMNNNVIKALARGLAAGEEFLTDYTDSSDFKNSIQSAKSAKSAGKSVTLRFDYRGVGDSQIELPDGVSVFDYWDDVEQKKDYRDALADIRAACAELTRITDGLPLSVVGYSFGAATGMMFGMECPAVEAMAGISPPLTRVDFGFLAGRPREYLKPCLLLCGKNDFVYSAQEAARLSGGRFPTDYTDYPDIKNSIQALKSAESAAKSGSGLIVEQLDGSDHFFRGQEDDLCRRVRKFLTEGM